MNWIKEHPYLTGGLVLGLLILYFVFRSASSSSASTSAGSVTSQGLSPAQEASLSALQMQTGAQIHATDVAATAHQNEINAQLAGLQLSKSVELQEAQLNQQTQLQNIVTSGQVQLNQTDAALQSVRAQVGGQVDIAQITANENEAITGMQQQTLQHEYDQQTAQAAIVAKAQTDQAAITGDVQKTIADYQFQTQYANIWANAETAQNQQNTQAAVTIHGQDVTGAIDLSQIAAQRDVTLGAQGVQNNYISTSGAIAEHQMDLQSQLLTEQGHTQDELIGLVQSGQLNKGGAGGQNQVQFLTSVFGHSVAPGAVESGGFNISIPGVGAFGYGGQG